MEIITYKYVGQVYKNCDPSAAQKSALSTAQAWGTTLKNSYGTVFDAGSQMFKTLNAKLQGIISNPQGYSAADLAAQNSQTLNRAAANAKAVNAAIGQHAGTQSGAVPGVESGVEQATRAKADTAILGNMANEQAGITEASDKLAVERQGQAIAQASALPGEVFKPAAEVGSEVTQANAATAQQANANAQASNSWMGIVGGLADAAVGGLTGGFGKGGGSKGGGGGSQTAANPTAGADEFYA